jgi:hypothetical protein
MQLSPPSNFNFSNETTHEVSSRELSQEKVLSKEDKNTPEDALIENVLLPTAHFSRSLLDSNSVFVPNERKASDAENQEEAYLLTYIENRKKNRMLSLMDGLLLGLGTGVLASLVGLPFAFVAKESGIFKHYPEKVKAWHHIPTKLLLHGIQQIQASERTPQGVLGHVLKMATFGGLSGLLLSRYLGNHQMKSARYVANELHHEHDQSFAVQEDHNKLTHPYAVKTYSGWKHYATDGSHHTWEAFKFNFGISTAILLAQILGLRGLAHFAKSEKAPILPLFQKLRRWIEAPYSPLGLMKIFAKESVQWIQAKSQLKNCTQIHEQLQSEVPYATEEWIFNRFNVLNMARLGVLSFIMAELWAKNNKQHIRHVEQNVNKTHPELKPIHEMEIMRNKSKPEASTR